MTVIMMISAKRLSQTSEGEDERDVLWKICTINKYVLEEVAGWLAVRCIPLRFPEI